MVISMKKKLRGGFLGLLAALMIPMSSFAAETEKDLTYSAEYMGSKYFSRLQTALEESRDEDIMSRVLAVAQSQEGYKDYCMGSTTPDAAREAGYLWTGEESENDNTSGSGNTEYTRWAQEYVMGRSGEEIYLDCDWCAIFASWCMYQAGYYSDSELKKYFYSYYADPREERTAGSWIEAFNFDHDRVWYTPAAAGKVEAYYWSRYTNTEVDPYMIPYKPGGMIFFSWDTSGRYFSHVGIVVSYDADTHELTYINGNVDYAVTTRVMDLDVDEEYHGQVKAQNADRIMAYAEYSAYTAPEKKEITADKTEFEWVRESGESLLIKTNSESKTVLLTADSGFFDSNETWPGQLILRYGEVTVGAPLLDYLPDGENEITLSFADGTLTIRVFISSPLIKAEKTEYFWNRDDEKGIEIETNSLSSSVTVYGAGITAKSKTGEVGIEDAIVTLSPRFLNRMKNGENDLMLVFDDGGVIINVTVYVTGWQKENGEWFWYLENGTKKTGWLSDGGKWYYLNDKGVMQTGWLQQNGKWFYLKPNGAMAAGWQKIDGKWYFFRKSGEMAASEWVSGYWIGKNGVWNYAYRGSWHKSKKGWWYGDTSGWYAKNATYSIDGKKYSFNQAGYWTAE